MKTSFSTIIRGPIIPAYPDDAPAIAPVEAPAPAPAPPEPPTMDELSAILAFDPFEQKVETPAPAPAPASTEGSEVAAAPPQPVEATPGLDVIAQLLARHDEILAKPPEPAKSEEPTSENAFPGLAIPDQLFTALNSEDLGERRQAMNFLIQGVANAAYKKAKDELQSFVSTGLPQQFSSYQEAQTQAATIKSDFYGTFKELDNPELYPLVQHVAGKYISELGSAFKGWTPEVRNEIGRRMGALLAAVVKPSAPAPATPAPFNPTPSARPVLEAPNDVLDTLFGS